METMMTDDQIAKLAQGFWERKTLAEIDAQTVDYKFDPMGFARALLAEHQLTTSRIDIQKSANVDDKPDANAAWKDSLEKDPMLNLR